MKPKVLHLSIALSVVLWFTLFEANFTQAQHVNPLLSPTSIRTSPSTPAPDQLRDKIQKEFERKFSTTASTSLPVRGTPGDWWADVVIGQPSFSQITPNEVVGNKLFNPGGVYVDRSTVPNRVYVYDAGNSRILGFASLGSCAAGVNAGLSCTSNSDCLGSVCTIDRSRPADIILGQPSPYVSACNGDSGFQNYPDFPAPTANTLCGLRPEGASILEGGSAATMATDADGNLYHPDYLNNRVVRYNDPFNDDTIADGVWGQADFNLGACNEGRSYGFPDEDSLCLIAPIQTGGVKSGVDIDSNGNLWVADTQNHRVLRFPYNPNTGGPAKSADLVLGQSNFTNAIAGSGLGQMHHPASVRVDASGKVYVLDGVDGTGTDGRLLVFIPPLSIGMTANQIFNRAVEPAGLELDASDRLWINESESGQILRLINGQLQTMIANVPYRSWGSIGVDRDGNVMLAGWDSQEVQIYGAPTFTWTSTFLEADTYGSFNQLGPRSMTDPAGLEVTDNQLIVADNTRLLFWNHPTQLTNTYPSADGVIGQPDFFTRPRWGLRYGRMRADIHGRLWILKGAIDSGTNILAYQLPLQSHAEPIFEIASPLPLKGGGSFSWSGSLFLGGIAYQTDCDCLWLSDTSYSRVFRINQVSSTSRFVDIVLGQTSPSGIHCNQGRDSDDGYTHPRFPSQDSLCHPGGLAFDKRGNLFVSDHNLEVAGNWRLLEYDAAGLPPNLNTAIFGLPADKVYGRNGSFTEPHCQDNDPICGPWEPVFYPDNDMVLGFNTYLGSPFPQVYQDPLTYSLPYTALGDYYSHAYSARLDSLNNLYVLDMTRSHVLIYWSDQTAPPTFMLTVNKNGTGNGTVTSSPAGINCGSDCSEAFDSGMPVELNAIAAFGSSFDGWTGDPDCADGQVTMNTGTSCTANFSKVPSSLYMTENNGTLRTVNQSTGATTIVGNMGTTAIHNLVSRPGSSAYLYGLEPTRLVKINRVTGQTSPLPEFNNTMLEISSPTANGIAISAKSPNIAVISGYSAASPNHYYLWKANIDTGAVQGAAIPTATWLYQLTYSLDGSILYGMDDSGRLVTVNPNTGAVTLVGDPGLSDFIEGLAFRPGDGALFAIDGYDQDRLVRLDPADGGVVQLIGNLGVSGPYGLAFIETNERNGADTVGVFRPSNGVFYLKNSNTTGYADIAINYGISEDNLITGDWDGDGIDTIGVYRGNTFYLRNSNTTGYADVYFTFGAPGDQPVAGDWDGDGIDTIGVYRSSTITFYLRNSNSAGAHDIRFKLGIPEDIGIAGDWDGDGKDTAGVFRPSNGVIYLKNVNATGYADIAINYGIGGDKPLTGDWNNDGIDTIGVLRGNTFYLRNSNTVGNADIWFNFGVPGDLPIAGNWDGTP